MGKTGFVDKVKRNRTIVMNSLKRAKTSKGLRTTVFTVLTPSV